MRGFTQYPWKEINSDDLVIVTSKNEGDGLVIAETIILGIPILLLDTHDLRRHDIPEENYFEKIPVATEKITKIRDESFKTFKVGNEIRQQIEVSRSPKVIILNWKKYWNQTH